MKAISPIDWTTIELHLRELPEAFRTRQTELQALEAQLADLQATHCTGKEHWRDAQNSKHRPKLYIIHPTGKACPIHGEPAPGKRIRTYIGSNEAKIHQAQTDIARGALHVSVWANTIRLHRAIKAANYTLKRVYWSLETELPEPPPDKATDIPMPA